MRAVRKLLAGYLALSAATYAAVVLLRNHSGIVNQAVWVRMTIVVLGAVLLNAFGTRAARGSVRAYRRLRLISAILLLAIAVIVATPGPFPAWLKLEQTASG